MGETELVFRIWKVLYFSFQGTVLHSMRTLFCLDTIHSVSKMLNNNSSPLYSWGLLSELGKVMTSHYSIALL